MITAQLQGRLGHAMFIIAAAYALGLRHDVPVGFDLSGFLKQIKPNNPEEYRLTLLRNVPEVHQPRVDDEYFQRGFDYYPIPYRPYMRLVGLFQSERFFADVAEEITGLFDVQPGPLNDVLGWCKRVGACGDPDRMVCVHVRRGDFLKLPQHRPPVTVSYLQEAMKQFGPGMEFVFVSDDIPWCQKHFRGDHIFFSDGASDYFDLTMMTQTRGIIISNSAFGWWGSWLNQHPDRQIIAPTPWFGPHYAQFNTKDLYTPDMLVLPNTPDPVEAPKDETLMVYKDGVAVPAEPLEVLRAREAQASR